MRMNTSALIEAFIRRWINRMHNENLSEGMVTHQSNPQPNFIHDDLDETVHDANWAHDQHANDQAENNSYWEGGFSFQGIQGGGDGGGNNSEGANVAIPCDVATKAHQENILLNSSLCLIEDGGACFPPDFSFQTFDLELSSEDHAFGDSQLVNCNAYSSIQRNASFEMYPTDMDGQRELFCVFCMEGYFS